jgi:hypothetical protein
MTEKKNRLIIVVTRADAPKGGDRDEFVQEWGFVDEKPFWRWKKVGADKSPAYVLILHGCDEKKGKLPKIFYKARQEKRSLSSELSKAWFCHHGMKEEDRQALEDEIKSTFPNLNSENYKPYSYSSMGSGPAVDNLLKKLPEDLVRAVGDIPKGRLIFVKRLHALQSCLLRLQFCIAILYLGVEKTGEEYRLQAIEEAKMIANEIGKTIGFEGFMKYLRRIENLTTGRDDIQDTVELVLVLSGAGDDKGILAAPEFWSRYTEPEPYNHLPDRHKLEDDFRLFAMALDCFMDVAANPAIGPELNSSGTGAKTG